MLVTTLGYLVNPQDGKVLILHRTKKTNDINHDKWIGIGGKLENGESVLACMQRECLEETGLIWNDPKLCGIITFNFRKQPKDALFSELMFLYSGTEFEGKLKECNEGELVWLSWQELFEKNLWVGDRLFLSLLRQEEPLFYMRLDYLGDQLKAAWINEVPVALSEIKELSYSSSRKVNCS